MSPDTNADRAERMGRPAATIEITRDKVRIRLLGLDKLWALRNGLVLHASEIESFEVVDLADAKRRLSWRVGGTTVPGLATAGRHRDRDGRPEFWAVHRSGPAVEITTAGDAAWRRIVVTVADPEGAAREARRIVDLGRRVRLVLGAEVLAEPDPVAIVSNWEENGAQRHRVTRRKR